KDKESRGQYAFHLVLGHHGLFSLSPILLLAAAGMMIGPVSRSTSSDPAAVWLLRGIAGLTLLLTLVVLGFYILNDTRNYGGWTSGPRWLIWLTPFWLLTTLPVADWLSSRCWGRALACVLLAVSVASVSYPAWSPWRHPWLYDFMEAQNWLPYGK